MSEYIEREKAIKIVKSHYRVDNDLLEVIAYQISNLPSADVQPVPSTGIGDMSDGYHTFNQLYYQRMMLFATIVRQNRDRAWKSLRHEDGELCFGGGWFIVGIDTLEGSYTYHYEDNYFSLFDCVELERSKHWDGHTEKDVTRLLSLPTDVQPVAHWISCSERLPEDEYVLISKKPTKISGDKWCVTVAIRMADPRSRKIQWRDTGFGVIPDDNVLAWMPLPSPYRKGTDE